MTTAYVFPGQGSQFVGMGFEQAQVRPVMNGIFKRADQALGFPLSQLCWAGPEAELNDTLNTQPAIFTHSVAAAAMVELSGEIDPPAYVAGHSLGELSALCVAGALTVEDGVRLARERGRLMRDAGERAPGSMAAVLGMAADALDDVCAKASRQHAPGVVVTNDNSPGQIVISGGRAAVEAAAALAKACGAKRVIPLKVSIASHSPLMAAIRDDYARAVEAARIRDARVPVVANTSVQPLTHADDLRAELVAQLTAPVRWTETVRFLCSQGVTNFIELGPSDVLSGLIKRTIEGANTRAIG